VLLFLVAIYKTILAESWNNFGLFRILFLILFAIVLALGGPLSAPIMIIGLMIILFSIWKKHLVDDKEISIIERSDLAFKKIPKKLFYLSLSIYLVCFYSIYLGLYNAENFFHQMPLSERFKLLPAGLYYSFTQKLGLPLLLLMILINLFMISRHGQIQDGKNIIKQANWIAVFCLIYILILPLGGYREYRPNIVRGDTLLPVIVCMIYLFALTALYLLNQKSWGLKNVYYGLIAVFLLIYTIADKSISNENDCERNALEKIAHSSERIIFLENNCNVMSWQKVTDYNSSKLNCDLLKRWRVVKDERLYYQN